MNTQNIYWMQHIFVSVEETTLRNMLLPSNVLLMSMNDILKEVKVQKTFIT
jgi:hypothetical protein